jgi:hypothetical protein
MNQLILGQWNLARGVHYLFIIIHAQKVIFLPQSLSMYTFPSHHISGHCKSTFAELGPALNELREFDTGRESQQVSS